MRTFVLFCALLLASIAIKAQNLETHRKDLNGTVRAMHLENDSTLWISGDYTAVDTLIGDVVFIDSTLSTSHRIPHLFGTVSNALRVNGVGFWLTGDFMYNSYRYQSILIDSNYQVVKGVDYKIINWLEISGNYFAVIHDEGNGYWFYKLTTQDFEIDLNWPFNLRSNHNILLSSNNNEVFIVSAGIRKISDNNLLAEGLKIDVNQQTMNEWFRLKSSGSLFVQNLIKISPNTFFIKGMFNSINNSSVNRQVYIDSMGAVQNQLILPKYPTIYLPMYYDQSKLISYRVVSSSFRRYELNPFSGAIDSSDYQIPNNAKTLMLWKNRIYFELASKVHFYDYDLNITVSGQHLDNIKNSNYTFLEDKAFIGVATERRFFQDSVSGISKYNINKDMYTQMGIYPNDFVYSINKFNDLLFLGGNFTEINGVPSANFACFDLQTSQLIPFPFTVNGPIHTMNQIGDTLWVGGNFTSPTLLLFGLKLPSLDTVQLVEFDEGASLNDISYNDSFITLRGTYKKVEGDTIEEGLVILNRSDLSMTPPLDNQGSYFAESYKCSRTADVSNNNLIARSTCNQRESYIVVDDLETSNLNYKPALIRYSDCDEPGCSTIKTLRVNKSIVIACGHGVNYYTFFNESIEGFQRFTTYRTYPHLLMYTLDGLPIKISSGELTWDWSVKEANTMEFNSQYLFVGGGNVIPTSVEIRNLEILRWDTIPPAVVFSKPQTVCESDSNIEVYYKLHEGTFPASIQLANTTQVQDFVDGNFTIDSIRANEYRITIPKFKKSGDLVFQIQVIDINGQITERVHTLKVLPLPPKPQLIWDGSKMMSTVDSLEHIWYTENGEYIGHSLSYIYTNEGFEKYRCRVIGSNGCLSEFSEFVVVGVNTHLNSEIPIAVYPNPSTNQLNIVIPENKVLALEIFDLQGKCVLQQKLSQTHTFLQTQLSSGVYTLRVRTEKGEVVKNQKWIVF